MYLILTEGGALFASARSWREALDALGEAQRLGLFVYARFADSALTSATRLGTDR
jgi:hypothetical protein